MNLPAWLLLAAVAAGLLLGYGWAWLELVVSSRAGWAVVAAVVLLAVVLAPERAG